MHRIVLYRRAAECLAQSNRGRLRYALLSPRQSKLAKDMMIEMRRLYRSYESSRRRWCSDVESLKDLPKQSRFLNRNICIATELS